MFFFFYTDARARLFTDRVWIRAFSYFSSRLAHYLSRTPAKPFRALIRRQCISLWQIVAVCLVNLIFFHGRVNRYNEGVFLATHRATRGGRHTYDPFLTSATVSERPVISWIHPSSRRQRQDVNFRLFEKKKKIEPTEVVRARKCDFVYLIIISRKENGGVSFTERRSLANRSAVNFSQTIFSASKGNARRP